MLHAIALALGSVDPTVLLFLFGCPLAIIGGLALDRYERRRDRRARSAVERFDYTTALRPTGGSRVTSEDRWGR